MKSLASSGRGTAIFRATMLLALVNLQAAAAPTPRYLLQAATTTGAGASVELVGPGQEGQRLELSEFVSCTITGTTPSATVNIEASADGVNWFTEATCTFGLTPGLASEQFPLFTLPPYLRANVTAISGAGAALTVTVYP